jgi:hypothetical protein
LDEELGAAATGAVDGGGTIAWVTFGTAAGSSALGEGSELRSSTGAGLSAKVASECALFAQR